MAKIRACLRDVASGMCLAAIVSGSQAIARSAATTASPGHGAVDGEAEHKRSPRRNPFLHAIDPQDRQRVRMMVASPLEIDAAFPHRDSVINEDKAQCLLLPVGVGFLKLEACRSGAG